MRTKLEPFQLSLLINMTQTGVVIFSLPQLLAHTFGYNGWIVVFLVSMAVTLNIGLIAIVFRLSRGRSIFDIMEHSIPKLVLAPLYLGLTAIWSMAGALVAKQYVIVFQLMALPTTNPMLIMAIIEALTFLLLIKGIAGISRAATVFFWLIIWMLLLLICFYKDFDWSRMTPFLFHGEGPWLEGYLSIYTAFFGYELVLLLFPYVSQKKLFLPVFMGNLITTVAYASVSLVCFGFFSMGQLQRMLYPTLALLAYLRFPFIERIENLLYGFFLFTVIVTITMYTWAAQQAVQRLIPQFPAKWLSLLIVLAVYAVSWIPDVLSEVQNWLRYIGMIETAVAFGLPLVLLVFLWLQKGKEVENNA